MTALLEATDVRKSYGDTLALDGVSLRVDAGEFVSIIGPNGAGKTTLVNVLTGLTPPSSGRVRFKGTDVAGVGPARLARLGMARSFQLVTIFPALSVADTLAVAALSRLRRSTRPFAAHPSAHVWGARSHDPSFPSDQASAAFAIAFAVLLFDRLAGALFLLAAHLALVRFEPFLSSRMLAQRTLKVAGPQDRFMIYGDQSYGSSWIFYLEKQVFLVNGRTTSMEFGSRFPDAPKIFLTDSDLVNSWNQNDRIFLFAPLRDEGGLRSLLGNHLFRVAQTSANAVYSNQP